MKSLKKNFPDIVKTSVPPDVEMSQVDIWFQDESRVGQQGSQTRIWAQKGTRPRVVKQQQFLSEYIYGAVCPAKQLCAGIVMPDADSFGFGKHLEEISITVPKGRHAVVVMDRAGWHVAKSICVPKNITIVHLPPYSPELNPQEQVWQYIKDNYLSNRVFENIQEIIQACCFAWSEFSQKTELIKSLTTRDWAEI